MIRFAIAAEKRVFLLAFNSLPMLTIVSFKSKVTPMLFLALFACMGIEQIAEIDTFAHSCEYSVGIEDFATEIFYERVALNKNCRV